MADILRGYEWSRGSWRYRDTQTGRFVARARIVNLLESQVDRAESRLANIVQGLAAGEIAPGYAQGLMRDELRRLHLQNAALGRGGFDRLSFADYGRSGRQLRDSYQRMTNLVNDMASGRATLPQALNRISGYVLEARQQFFAAEREALRESDRRMEARRTLHARESCVDCIGYARMGWQPAESVPLPGTGGTRCGRYCRCSVEYREAEVTQPLRAERLVAA